MVQIPSVLPYYPKYPKRTAERPPFFPSHTAAADFTDF